jgi:hypothetical protein
MPAELSRVSRMPFGVTNAAPRQTMANYGCPDPVWSAYIDLDYIQLGDTAATTQTGGGSFGLVAGVGGLAGLVSGAVANTIETASTNQAVFQVPQTNNAQGRMFFKWAGTVDSLLGTIQVGFVASQGNSPQGIYIQSVVTTGALQLIVKNGTGTSTFAFPANLALVAGTQVELGIEVDIYGNVFAYYNPTTGECPQNTNGTLANGPVVAAYIQQFGALTGLFLPTGVLFASQGVIPTTAAARTLTIDYFVAAQVRTAVVGIPN